MRDLDAKAYTLLFVEDEELTRQNYTHFLERYFNKVYAAKDGEEAFGLYNKYKPHIMIVDINLPKYNGLDLIRDIRKKDQSVKIIMLTAHSETKYLLEAAELKLTKYLIKPVSRDELSSALNMAIHELTSFRVSATMQINLGEGYIWESERKELFYKNSEVLLTNKERKVLTLLLTNPNTTLGYEDIIYDVWYDDYEDKLDALKTIVKNLRRKLPEDSIKNVFSIGYKIEV